MVFRVDCQDNYLNYGALIRKTIIMQVVDGTLAKTIINEPKEVTLMNGITASLNMQVHYISFSA